MKRQPCDLCCLCSLTFAFAFAALLAIVLTMWAIFTGMRDSPMPAGMVVFLAVACAMVQALIAAAVVRRCWRARQ
jgi:uncharacterized membrane protein YqjE